MVSKWYIVLFGLVAVQAAGLTAMDNEKAKSPRKGLNSSDEMVKMVFVVNALNRSAELRKEIAKTHSQGCAGSYYYNSSDPSHSGLRKDNKLQSMAPYWPFI